MSSNTVIVSQPSALGYLTNNVQPHSLFSGDSQVMNYFPVITTGNTAVIYPHWRRDDEQSNLLCDDGQWHRRRQLGAYFAGISDTNAWRFTTKVGGPANPTNMIVSADGTKDFLTVQGAVDSVPPGNTNYTLINIREWHLY